MEGCFKLGNVMGVTDAKDTTESYNPGVRVGAPKRKFVLSAEKKLRQDLQVYDAAVTGKGADACPYCLGLRKAVEEENEMLLCCAEPEIVLGLGIVTEAMLPYSFRGGSFTTSPGVRTDQDHILMHLNRANDALNKERYLERVARRLAASIREAAALEKLVKGIVEAEHQGRNERRKGGRFTKPAAKWHSGNRRNKG